LSPSGGGGLKDREREDFPLWRGQGEEKNQMQPASKINNYHYNKNLQPIANKLRKEMTKAEACLWKYVLRARKLKGYRFRRQRPVLIYIADFMCTDLMLVIEVDGITHWHDDVVQKDMIKQDDLEKVGFTVLRFDDDDVLNDIENVERVLIGYIDEFEIVHPPPAKAKQRTGHTPASGGKLS
jgi:very-short-patch-repair endonuclease